MIQRQSASGVPIAESIRSTGILSVFLFTPRRITRARNKRHSNRVVGSHLGKACRPPIGPATRKRTALSRTPFPNRRAVASGRAALNAAPPAGPSRSFDTAARSPHHTLKDPPASAMLPKFYDGSGSPLCQTRSRRLRLETTTTVKTLFDKPPRHPSDRAFCQRTLAIRTEAHSGHLRSARHGSALVLKFPYGSLVSQTSCGLSQPPRYPRTRLFRGGYSPKILLTRPSSLSSPSAATMSSAPST